MDWECLKDNTKCTGESCSLFMYPKDCSINSMAISLRAIAATLQEISDAMKVMKNE
jgi:hypothetical protein